MLKNYNAVLIIIGNKLRNKILFDIFEKINYNDFFKVRFFKNRTIDNLILKHI